jgi:hypothetical protein
MRTRFLSLFIAFAALPVAGSAQVTPAPSAFGPAQEIWFSPRQHWKPGTGVEDWDQQFQSDAQWPVSAAHVNVFVLTGGPIMKQSDQELRTMAAFLTAHHMKIALEMGIIEKQKGSKYGGGEGYMFPGEVRAMAVRLKSLNITPDYIRMDEPIWFGHYDKNDSWTEQLSIDDLVTRITHNARELTNLFPNMQFVDIDTVPPLTMEPDWQAAYREYKQKLEAAVGKPIIALQVDLQWSNPSWKHDVKEIADFAHGLGMKFGIIYNNDGPGDGDLQWLESAEKGFTTIESELGLIPEQPVFQSWDKYPTHSLPETSPTAHTHLIYRYLLPRTRFSAQREGNTVRGLLTTEGGQPAPGAEITMSAPELEASKPLPLLSVSGTVPAAARQAIMGIRINCECLSDGHSDLLVGNFSYQESGAGSISRVEDYPADVQKAKPRAVKTEVVKIGGATVAHLIADEGHTLGFNSPAFPVTPGAQFQFSAPADLVSGEALYGRVILIWLNDQKQGISAVPIIVNRKFSPLGVAMTSADGRFSIPVPPEKNATAGPLRLSFDGTANLRAALSVIP